MRIQAIIIAFCFGALLEALAGFGTPVAITVVMLMALGFRPIKAAAVALIANTAPVAFGALATPIVTLATVTSGASDDPRLTVDTLGAHGRPADADPGGLRAARSWSFVVDGRRGLRQTWLPALVAGLVFGVAQFVASNYISVPLTDIIAVAAVRGRRGRCCCGSGSRPRRLTCRRVERRGAVAGAGGATAAAGGAAPGRRARPPRRRHAPGRPAAAAVRRTAATGAGARQPAPRSPAPTRRTSSSSCIFSIANITAVKDAWPRSRGPSSSTGRASTSSTPAGDPLSSTTFTFNWLPAAGTLMIIAGHHHRDHPAGPPARALRPTSTPTSSCATRSSP